MKIKLCKIITSIFLLTAIIVPTVNSGYQANADTKGFAIQNPYEVL